MSKARFARLLAGVVLVPSLLLTLSCKRAVETVSTVGTSAPPLRLGIYSDPLGFDPHRRDEYLTFSVLLDLYDGLVAFDDHLRIRPALAVSWENPNDLVWRFHLRPGVHFHDGRELSADDVVFSLDRARRQPTNSVATYLVAVQQVRAVDRQTIEIVTDRPYPILLNKLTHVLIVPAGSPDRIVEPIGTGPYRLADDQPGKRLLLRAFGDYWGPPPATSEVELVPIADAEARLRRLLEGKVDAILDVAPDRLDDLEATPGCHAVPQEGLSTDYLQMRVDVPPFDDLRVRQAVNLALDRPALVREVLRGQGKPAYQMVAPAVFGYAPGIAPVERDLARARALLAQAGYPHGFATDLEYRSSRNATAIARQLAEAGIRVALRPRPWAELYPRLEKRQVGFYYGAFLAASADASDLFDSKAHTRTSDGYGDSNFNLYSNPELDRLIESSGRTLDMRMRREILERSMDLLMQDLPLVPLFSAFQIHGVCGAVALRPRADARVLAIDLRRTGRDG